GWQCPTTEDRYGFSFDRVGHGRFSPGGISGGVVDPSLSNAQCASGGEDLVDADPLGTVLWPGEPDADPGLRDRWTSCHRYTARKPLLRHYYPVGAGFPGRERRTSRVVGHCIDLCGGCGIGLGNKAKLRLILEPELNNA